MDEDDKTGVLGCMTALVVIGALIGGVVWFVNRDVAPQAEEPAATAAVTPPPVEKKSRAPVTHVEPVREKTVVAKAANLDPLARHIVVDDPVEEAAAPAAGVSATVQDLGQITEDGPPPGAIKAATDILEMEQLCYQGRTARRAPSLFDPRGFAITYGADDFSGGNPRPRLEFFFHPPEAPTVATYLSMTDGDMPGFPANHEMPVVYEEGAIHTLIARWIAAVATETCPAAKAPK